MSQPTKIIEEDRLAILRIIKDIMGWQILNSEHTSLGWMHPHQGDHDWLNNSANYPNITIEGARLLLWRAPETDGSVWNPLIDDAAALEVVAAMYKGFHLSCRIAYIHSKQIGVAFYTSVGAQHIFTESMNVRGAAITGKLSTAISKAALSVLDAKSLNE